MAIGDIVHLKGLAKASGVGQCRPAIIVRQWIPGDNVDERHVGTAQLVAFPDGSNDGASAEAPVVWRTSVQHRSKAPATADSYHYPSECEGGSA